MSNRAEGNLNINFNSIYVNATIIKRISLQKFQCLMYMHAATRCDVQYKHMRRTCCNIWLA